MDDDRLTHVQKAIQHYVLCCATIENLQSAHDLLLKATQQALQLPSVARPPRYKLEELCREQVALLNMRHLNDAQRELFAPTRSFRDLNDDTDEELRDVRENVFPHSD